MNSLRLLVSTACIVTALHAAAPVERRSEPTDAEAARVEAIGALRQSNPAAAVAVFEARVAPGKSRDARDVAIAEEWLGLAIYFFNTREITAAQTALGEAVRLATGVKQKKGADRDLYYFYRNVGALAEAVTRNRAQALDYYDLALTAAAANPEVAPAEVAELKRKIAKTQADEAQAQKRPVQ